MNKNNLNFILTLLISIILGLFLPWWSIMISAIFVGFVIPLKGFKVFLIPFFGIFIYWIVYSFILGIGNDFILTKKISMLFSLGKNWILILVVTALIGGLAAGVAAVLGKQLANVTGRTKKYGKH